MGREGACDRRKWVRNQRMPTARCPLRLMSASWPEPLSWPGVATVGILSFVSSWNAYMLPLFLLNDSSKYTLPLGVQMFSSQHSVDTAQVLAFTSLSMIPALICFTIFQKKIVGGLTGAVKG